MIMKQNKFNIGDWVYTYNPQSPTSKVAIGTPLLGFIHNMGKERMIIKVTSPQGHDPIVANIEDVFPSSPNIHPDDIQDLINLALDIDDQEMFKEYTATKKLYESIDYRGSI